MLRERLLSIWSLRRESETVLWVTYRAEARGRCRVLQIVRMEDCD
ncbi:MAG TPA: hypothetical protein VMG40_18275 [Bryobacteraceae bacterium]|nr:hypothetical protein [Bryobacteraceae bacterium]